MKRNVFAWRISQFAGTQRHTTAKLREATITHASQASFSVGIPLTVNRVYTQKGWKKLKLQSLAYRRRRGDMIEVYKYTHSEYEVPVQPVEVELRRTRGHSYTLLNKSSSTSQRQKFFSMKVVNSWNSLVVTAPSLNAFKGRLDAHWDDLKHVVDFPAHDPSKWVSYVALVLNFQQDWYPKEKKKWISK